VIAGSGCTWQMLSGSTLEVQPGATVGLGASLSTTGTLTANALVVTTTSSLGGNISSATGAITIADTINVTGAGDFDSTLNVDGSFNYGTQSLYPLGYASDAQQIECGVTATFTDTIAVTASALTTATYAIATQITDPAATAAFLSVDAPSANVFNIDSWEDDYSVGTTGVDVYWCAIGPQ